MKLINNVSEFEAWQNSCFDRDVTQPVKYPCYAYTLHKGWMGQTQYPIYLYIDDVRGMLACLESAQHGAQRTETKVVLDGTFQCPECHFTEKHLASCSRR